MGWQEARAKHKLSGPLNDQKVEDLVARRILRGLGYVAKQLPELERALGFKDTWDDPMWPRVRKVLGALAWASNVKVFPLEGVVGLYEPDVRETGPGHKQMLELIRDMFIAAGPQPLVFTRIKGTQTSLAYFTMRYGDTFHEACHINSGMFKPPFSIIGEHQPNLWIACQDTEQFVAQFGPYKRVLDDSE